MGDPLEKHTLPGLSFSHTCTRTSQRNTDALPEAEQTGPVVWTCFLDTSEGEGPREAQTEEQNRDLQLLFPSALSADSSKG